VSDDRRLIEDLIPVDEISRVSASEKVGGRKGHPSTLHLWWARRPLAAARAAVYATLVQAADTPDEAKSAEYFTELCRWGASEERIADARERVLAANGGKPPRVLDMFAGGGAIPLEAARLGCEATAVELNPVAHLIELCMLDYPQRFGPSLADDVREWGERWVEEAWDRVGHLYPPVAGEASDGEQLGFEGNDEADEGRRPIAYLWTRTVRCPNHQLGEHRIPLVRQTWLARKKNRYIALKPVVDKKQLSVDWEVVERRSADDLGFDPAGFSSRGRATCFVCGASVDANYVKDEGKAGRMEVAPLAAVLPNVSGPGRDYHDPGSFPLPDPGEVQAMLAELDISPPDEIINDRDTLNFKVPLYGLSHFGDLFTPRQLTTLCALAQGVQGVHDEMLKGGMDPTRAEAVCVSLGLVLDRVADYSNSLCNWHSASGGEKVNHAFARQALPMVWDFAEANPFAGSSGDVRRFVQNASDVIRQVAEVGSRCQVKRTSATTVPVEDGSYDAVITDPPYYDNISYADLSDFFYVWLKRSVGFLFPEHLAGELTPKRREMIVAPYRHEGGKDAAREFYEHEMEAAFREAHRVLKPNAPLVCVYAHKTTLGWASLVEALRRAGFTVTEAWPLDTEMPERSIGRGTASLASSIFLVARRREGEEVGDHGAVMRELDSIIGERLDRLTDAGVSGSDLIIATIGAGLRPFTEYERVQLANGEEVPAKDFLDEVQSRVLNAVLAKVHGLADGVGTIDARTRFYVISRYSFGYRMVEFDEANNLAHSAGIELSDLAEGAWPLVRISKDKVSFLDYTERGDDPELGLMPDGAEISLIDVLHGLLWRAGREREEVGDYLAQAGFDPTALRLVAQALQGKGLREEGESKPDEAQASERLLGAWKTLVDENLMTTR
jgi:putative DNA methylase